MNEDFFPFFLFFVDGMVNWEFCEGYGDKAAMKCVTKKWRLDQRGGIMISFRFM